MCDTCGCGDPEIVAVEVHERSWPATTARRAHNREHFRDAACWRST